MFDQRSRPVWSYWAQGFNDSPYVVEHCAAALEGQSGGVFVGLRADQLPHGIGADPAITGLRDKISHAHYSDLLRTELLIKYGGVWADPTVYPNQDILRWVGDHLDSGVFFFHRPGRDRIIANWFIAAEPNNPLLIKLLDRLLDYWWENDFEDYTGRASGAPAILARVLNRNLTLPRLWLQPWFNRLVRSATYMVYHYMVYDLICTDREARRIWEKMPKVSAEPPHALQRHGLLKPLTAETKRLIDHPDTPVFKLSWKLPKDEIPEGCVLDYLFNRDGV